MLVLLVSFAFGFGYLLTRIGLPPMVGFLLAGFVYNIVGFTPPPGLDMVSELGITLLLFSIGLKLDVKALLRAEIWASATAQMLLTSGVLIPLAIQFRTIYRAPKQYPEISRRR